MITLIFIGVWAVVFGYLAYKRLDWALLVIIAALPSYLIRFKLWGLPSTVLEVMIVLAVVSWIWHNWRSLKANIKHNFSKRQIKWRYPFDWEIVAVLALAWVATLVASDKQAALGIFKAYFWEVIVLYLLIVNVFQKKQDLVRLVRALAVSATIVALVAWYQYFIDMEWLNPVWSQQTPARATSFFPYANAVGLYLAPISLILLGYLASIAKWVEDRWVEMLLIGGVIVLSVGAIYFARSEGAMIGVLAGVVAMGLVASVQARRWTVISLAMMLVAVLTVAPLRAWVWQKATMSDLAGEIRQQQWRETRKMLATDPIKSLLGVGLSGFPAAVSPYHQEGIFFDFDNDADFQQQLKASADYRATHWQPVNIYQYPHNILLNFWSELGILGILIFVWLLLKFLYYARLIYVQTGEYVALGLGGAMLALWTHGWVDVPYFKNDLAALFWMMMAMLAILMINYERSLAKNNRR